MPQTLRSIVAGGSAIRVSRLRLIGSGVLVAVAIGGSLVYGGSLSLVLPNWTSSGAALWLALSAGLAWLVFIPTLAIVLRRPPGWCLQCSLVSMAAGEVVLLSGALVNVLLAVCQTTAHAALINAFIVAVSNVVMAAVLAAQFRQRGVSVKRTLVLWMLVLNGSGAAFFGLSFPLFRGL